MKKILATVLVALLTAPAAMLACDGGTAGFDLPPRDVPVPTAVESIANVFSGAGLYVGLALGTVIGAIVARRRKLLTGKSAAAIAHPVA